MESFYDTYKDSPIPVLKNKQSVQKQIDSISSKGGQKLNEEESRLYGIMNGVKGVKGVKSDSWSDTEPFSVIKNMITSVHNAQMKLRTDDDYQSMQAFNRLKEVKSSLYDSLDNAVKNIGDYEAQKVKNGLMPQENTIYNLLSKDKEDILANQERISSRGDSQGIAPGYEQGTTNVLSGGGGTEIPSSGEFSGSTGSKGLPENASQPVKYDQQAQDQYKAARAHTLEQKNLFTKGPVGEILKPGPSGQRYLMADGSVNPSIFNRTPKSPGAIKQYMMALKASGFPEEKTALDLQDAAVNQMRHPSRGIVNDEGTINPDKLQRFIDQHASAIDAVPGLRDKLANAKQAQQTYFDSVQRQAQSKKEFEDSQAARMIGKHPVDAMKDVFSGTDRNEIKQRIQALKNDIGDNSEANKSLKRNMTDFILEKVMGKSIDDVASINTKNPKAFRDFLTNNKQALSLVYSPEEMSSLKAVALDSYRKAVVGKTSLISGQSNSAADLHAMMSENGSTHPHEIINDHALNFLIGSSAHAHPVAAGATIGAKFLNKIRNAFLENDIKDEKTLKTVAALHPEIARLFVQISDNYNPTAIKKFAVQLHKIAVESLIGTLSDPKEAQ